MIATQITFDKFSRTDQPKYKIGDNVIVSIVPASFPDLRTVHSFNGEQASLQQHHFFLNIQTPQGTVKHSIAGVPSLVSGKATYTFNHQISPSLEELGTNIITFHYKTANGQDIPLSNYDSTFEELYDETIAVNFTVNSELHVLDVAEKPKKDDFFYGNDIVFKFKVRDSLTNKILVANNPELANVYLSLKHTQSGKSRVFTSTNQPSRTFKDVQGKLAGFIAEWAITPNAIRGPGFLTLSVQDVDGTVIPLYKENSKEEVQFSVTIGGDIFIKSESFTLSTSDARETAFLVQFNLFCSEQEKKLKDAQLRSSVVYRSNKDDVGVELFQLPVAANDEGLYQVSWTVPRTQAKSGEYQLKFLREVDRLRADQVNDEETSKSLFEITVHHQAAGTSNFPLRTEFFAVLFLGATFFWTNSKKTNYYNKV